MTPIELVAVACGLACVAFTVRQNIWCWPTGLVMVSLYIIIFYQAKLYSDMLLQVVYVFLQIYGWYAWLYGGPQQTELNVTRLPPEQVPRWLAAGLAGTVLLGTAMRTYTDASLPYVDAFAAVASLIAQWLMGRKRLESWLIWILVDVVSIGMYLAKSLYLTAGLYVAFLILAAIGFFEWKKAASAPALA